MRPTRLIAAAVLTATAFSSTIAGLAIKGTVDEAFAAPPPQCKQVNPPVSGTIQNPGQHGQNPGQKGQNAQCQPPPPPLSTTVIIPASCFTPDPAQGYELAAVASPGATGVAFEETLFGSGFPIGRATQDLSAALGSSTCPRPHPSV